MPAENLLQAPHSTEVASQATWLATTAATCPQLSCSGKRSALPPVGLYCPDPCPQCCTGDGLDNHDDWEIRQAVECLHLVTCLGTILHLQSACAPDGPAFEADGDI